MPFNGASCVPAETLPGKWEREMQNGRAGEARREGRSERCARPFCHPLRSLGVIFPRRAKPRGSSIPAV